MQRKIVILGVVCIALVIVASLSKTQAQPPNERRGGPPGMGMRDPEQMRRMMAERMKEQLGVTDQEWKVMQPKLQKVMDLTRQISGSGRMGMFFGRQRPRQFARERSSTDASESERTAVEKATEELQELLDSESTTPDQIKAKLTTLREAKEKAKQELAQAQQELKKILTLKQEARLVLMGLLN
jgi:chromosome segregation ATPase